MIKASELIALFWVAINEIWGYIWGTAGKQWTQALQNQKVNYMVKNFGSDWKTDKEAKKNKYYYSALYGGKWIGHMVADCSGLFAWAFAKLGGAIAHGSNSIWDRYCKSKGKLSKGNRTDGMPLKPGTAVFVNNSGSDRTHIGLYVGDGTVIEAASAQKGVITSAITDKKWAEWGELKGVEYDDTPLPDVKPTLKKGDQGRYVTLAQTELIQKGYSCGSYGADGKFGKATEAAVKQFQTDHKIEATGIINQATWDALDSVTPSKLYIVCVPHMTYYQAEALVKQYAGASMVEEGS